MFSRLPDDIISKQRVLSCRRNKPKFVFVKIKLMNCMFPQSSERNFSGVCKHYCDINNVCYLAEKFISTLPFLRGYLHLPNIKVFFITYSITTVTIEKLIGYQGAIDKLYPITLNYIISMKYVY